MIARRHNTRYKTLVYRRLFKLSATHQVRCNWIGKQPAIPNDFIPPSVMVHLRPSPRQILQVLMYL